MQRWKKTEKNLEQILYNYPRFGKNSTEVINVKNKMRQMFKDKLVLVMLVLGLLTIVAAAGVVTIQRGNGLEEENPYLSMEDRNGPAAEETGGEDRLAGASEQEREVQDSSAAETAEEGKTNLAAGEAETEAVSETEEGENTAAQAGAGNSAASAVALRFGESASLGWPVQGEVLIGYSMDTTTYFPTLEQYKCSPGMVVQSEVSTPVNAPAAARVAEIGSNEELGSYVVLELGDDYAVTCGQLKEISVAVNDYVEKGTLLGYVAEPTKYYSVEGPNVYLELTHGGSPVDPLDYLE